MAKHPGKHTAHIAKLLETWKSGRGDVVKAAARAEAAPAKTRKKKTRKKASTKTSKFRARKTPFMAVGGGSSGAITGALNRQQQPDDPAPPAADETQVDDGTQGDGTDGGDTQA